MSKTPWRATAVQWDPIARAPIANGPRTYLNVMAEDLDDAFVEASCLIDEGEHLCILEVHPDV